MFNFYFRDIALPNVHKKDDPLGKTKYRPTSMLPILLKAAFERCLHDQIFEYIDNILLKAQWGLPKVSTRSIH